MRFNIIGAGRLGKNLALSLLSHGHCELVAICNRHLSSAVAAVAELGSGIAVNTLSFLPAVDVTFITAPDDHIAGIATGLTTHGSVVVHCSGVLSSEVLAPVKKQGSQIASIHPLKAFRESNMQVNAFKDCDCVVEGDPLAVELLTRLFSQMGAQMISIGREKKSTYHAAAVMASNYMVTLAACAVELLTDIGITQTQAKDMTQRLMQSTLTNLQEVTHVEKALTGPLARGDLNTISQHLQVISTPHIDALYRAAGLATLPLTNLDAESKDALRNRLHEH